MIRHGLFDATATLVPSADVLKAMHALYWRGDFLGTCVAVLPRVLVTAGHHFNAVKDDVGDFTIRQPDMTEAHVEHALKNGANDILVLWIDRELEHIPLRGFLPPIQARVATVWLSTKWPHETIVSPGVVVESGLLSCVARGTVSTSGSSGAPVIDHFGDHVVGMHLTSNTRDGSRVSGFIPARKIISVLAETGVSCRAL